MQQLTLTKAPVLLGLFILVVTTSLTACLALPQQQSGQRAQIPGGITPRHLMSRTPGKVPVISRGVPAFASSAYYPASNANDDNYDTTWRSQGTPAWLAYDLSTIPASLRGKVLVVWYNESYTLCASEVA